MGDLVDAFAAIDAANEADPRLLDGKPLARVQGELASGWLSKLDPQAPDELQVAVRAHHLRRWELQRADYPAGRAGYLKWRRDNKAHQADALAAILEAGDWDSASIERTRVLLQRTKPRSDPDTQTLEDAACLVFLETQFETMGDETERDHLVSIVSKTLNKMSMPAIALATSIELSPGAGAVLRDAVDDGKPNE